MDGEARISTIDSMSQSQKHYWKNEWTKKGHTDTLWLQIVNHLNRSRNDEPDLNPHAFK